MDDQLGALFKTMNPPPKFQPTVEATFLDEALRKWPTGWLRYAWAGGASVAGAHHAGIIFAVIPKAEWEAHGSPENFLEANPLPFEGGKRRIGLRDWLNSTSVAIQTNELGLVGISRRAVVQYVANRKGGVHFDPNRELEPSPARARGKRRRRRDVEAHLLDHGLLRVGHLSGPEFEIASMVRAVGESDWAAELTRIVEEIAPDQLSGDPNEMKFWSWEKQPDGTGWATMTFQPKTSESGSEET